jgi:hypothetical protein
LWNVNGLDLEFSHILQNQRLHFLGNRLIHDNLLV